MQKTALNVVFSTDFEVKRIQYTLGKIGWFKEHGYHVSLPTSIEMDVEYTERDLEMAVKSEFDEQAFKVQEDIIKQNWTLYSDKFFDKLSKTGMRPSDIYTVYLTKYGVGGSYSTPNEIISNIQKCWNVGLVRTIFHEIVHLNIESLIQKYEVSHWVKERIVDLTLAKLLPEISRMQELKIDCSKIDEVFEANFPDIEKTIKLLGKI